MNIYTGLLFQQGHIQDPQLALSLANDDQPAKKAKSAGEAGRSSGAERRERGPSFKRGAIFAVCCSTALSPFR